MLSSIICTFAFLTPGADGRTEVEGLVVTAVGRTPVLHFGQPPGMWGDLELEFTVSSKGGGQLPIFRFEGPIRVVGADKKVLSSKSAFTHDAVTRKGRGSGWSTQVAFKDEPPMPLPAVEGTITVAPSTWKTVTFEGASLRPNATVSMEGGGKVRLTVLDSDDGILDLRFKVVFPPEWQSRIGITSARAILTDSKGKEFDLTSQGGGVKGINDSFEHGVRFPTSDAGGPNAIRKIRLELPTPRGPGKLAPFRIQNVPVDDAARQRKAGPR